MFDVGSDDHIELKNYALTPTTIDHLADGFFTVLNKILNVSDARPLLEAGKVNINYSSSAKGGLAVAALGLVPTITLESAKVTAHSAGAKVSQHFAYKLNRTDIRKLEQTPRIFSCSPAGRMAAMSDTDYKTQKCWRNPI